MQNTPVCGVPVHSPCLYSPVSMLIYEREGFPTQRSKWLISWVTKPGEMDTVWTTMSEKSNGKDTLAKIVKYPPSTWLNPD